MTIALLNSNIINKIAAGEVVERPSSVIKELVENAIDAGSTLINVNIRDGGKSFIEVKDNGCGMNETDLQLCIMRHATSKIKTADDLFNISTMGFRGEALPAMGAIARLKITTRRSDQDMGWTLTVEGGKQERPEPAKASVGTTVQVSDLFFATPARLKFMKTTRTELTHISDIINRISLAHPNIGFQLTDDDKVISDYQAIDSSDISDGLKRRINQVVGKDFVDNSCMIDYTDPNALDDDTTKLSIKGFCGLPTLNRSNSNQQWFFVNNRPVKDKVLYGAIRSAYQDFLARDRFATVVLFITLDSCDVDINVHPAKTEVRFLNIQNIRSNIIQAIKQTLINNGTATSDTIANKAFDYMQVPESRYQATASGQAPNHNIDASQYRHFQSPPSNAQKESAQQLQAPQSGMIVRDNITYEPNTYSQQDAVNDVADPIPPSFFATHEQQQLLAQHKLGYAKTQLDQKYIIAQTNDNIIIVDQHAAHERINYEQMKHQYHNNTIKRQSLLIPVDIELPESQITRLMACKDSLAPAGIVIRPLNSRTIQVEEVPVILKNSNIKTLLTDILDHIETNDDDDIATEIPTEKVNAILADIACRASIKAGFDMTIEQMNSLLRQMESFSSSGQCNHGRPTYITLKLTDVDKLFERA